LEAFALDTSANCAKNGVRRRRPYAAPVPSTTSRPALRLTGVTVERDGRALVDAVDWQVRDGERWVLLGPNGSGKTTLLRIASLYLHPTRGVVEVLGETLGRTDVRVLRERVAVVSASFADLLRPGITAHDVVVTARYAALETWWHTYTATDHERADDLLAQLGVAHVADHAFATLSSGERQRVQLARTLMGEPGLVLLDEPMAGLDIGGREELVDALADFAARPGTPPVVLVTHHADEIPPRFTHALLLRDGRGTYAGPSDGAMTDERLSATFGVSVTVERRGDRWLAWPTSV
jgi:iron complex transport system ATP-binding protein